jgi:hypothetical protein
VKVDVHVNVVKSMKVNLLIIVTIVFLTFAYQSNELLTFDNPTIKIKDINVINSYKGKMICYTINLYSPSQISEFIAIPDIAGANSDSSTKIEFDNHTRRATVVYYYAVPKEIASEDIKIKFCLNDKTHEVNSIVNTNNF